MSRYITKNYKTYNTIIKDCPIILNKTRILFDKETNLTILQIALTNLSNKELKKITFSITTYDDEKQIINKEKTIIIEENIKENSEYSINKPIIFKSKKISYINVVIKEITYTNNKIWCNNKKNIEKEINREKFISTNSILYKTLCFNNVKFNKLCYPEFNDNYWRCSCSTLNLYSQSHCKLCNTSKQELESFFDYSKIKKLILEYKKNCIKKRKQEQKRKKLEQKRKKEEKEKNKQKILKTLKILKKYLKIFMVLLLIIILLISFVNMCLNKINYYKALNLYNNKDYIESIAILEKIDTKYSKELLSDIYYSYGKYLLEKKKYIDSIKYFKKTTNNDKEQFINEARYKLGLEYLNDKLYFTALEAFESISIIDYKDKEEKIKEINYLIAKDYFEDEYYNRAEYYFGKIKDYKDSSKYLEQIKPITKDIFDDSNCIDDNGNAICSIYTFKVKESASDGEIALDVKEIIPYVDKSFEGQVVVSSSDGETGASGIIGTVTDDLQSNQNKNDQEATTGLTK